jgi:hypothetical protein
MEPGTRPGGSEDPVTRRAARQRAVALTALAPAGWRRVALPDGTAVLSYPPSLRWLAGDKDAVSAARLSPGGRFQLYLNATPRQGTERLAHWAAFRTSASVIVAASPATMWAQARPLLLRAVAAYRVR